MSFRFLASEASKEDHSKCLAGCTFPASDMYIKPYSSLQPSFGDGLSRKPFISSGGILVTSNCGFLGTKGDRGLWENSVCHTGFPGQDLSFFVQRSALSLQINLHSGLQISIDFDNYFYNYFYNYFDCFDYFDCFHITFTSDLLWRSLVLEFELPYATAAPAPGSKTCRPKVTFTRRLRVTKPPPNKHQQ